MLTALALRSLCQAHALHDALHTLHDPVDLDVRLSVH
jgi:hypothetical protein